MASGLVKSAARLTMLDTHLSPSDKPSLCFSSASDLLSKKQISWEEYLHHCLMHFVKGFPTHEEDIVHGSRLKNQDLLAKDPFGHALWCWQSQTHGVKDVSQLEVVFQAFSYGSVDDLKSRLDPLGLHTAETMRRSLAFLALQDRKLDVLKYVINDGQETYDPFISSVFRDRALAVDQAREPELYDIIHQSTWMRHVERRRAEREDFERRHPGDRIGAAPGAEKDFDDWILW